MASTQFSILLLLLLAIIRQAFVTAHQTQVDVQGRTAHAQSGVRLPRGLLGGLVGAVLSPVLAAGGDDCSSAHGGSVNIGATLPLGISAGISGSAADAHSRSGCRATAGSNAGGVNSGASASAGGNENTAGGSGTTHPAYSGHGSKAHGVNEVLGQGGQQGSFGSGEKAINSGTAGAGVGWGSHSESHASSGSAGQTRPSIAANLPANWGSGFSNGGGLEGGVPVRGEAAALGETSSQSVSASFGQGGLDEDGQGNLGDGFNSYSSGHVAGSNNPGVASSNPMRRGQGEPADGLYLATGPGMIGDIHSSSSVASKASSSAASFAGARPGTSHSSSRSDANSSSHSKSFVTST